MKKETVNTDYSRMADNSLDNLAKSSYDKLVNSTHFNFAADALPRMLLLINTYRVKLDKSKKGTSTDVAEKNAAKKELVDELKAIAAEVNRQADGDLVKLTASGFTLAKKPVQVGVLPKPAGFSVKSGNNSGQLAFSTDAHKNAVMYYFYSSPVPAPANIVAWRLSPSTKCIANISGYTPGQQYECKCAYKGAAEELVYSDSIMIYAQ
jgi:hypothetical protein